MTTFHYIAEAVKTLSAKGRRNGLKLLTLAIGLAVGLVLASKVCFEQSYDTYHESSDRIYYLNETTSEEGALQMYNCTSGGTASRMKELYPEIEESTRFTWIEREASLLMTETSARIKAPLVWVSDSNLFKILDRECLAGDITSTLGIKDYAVISSSMARKISSKKGKDAAAEVIGMQFALASYDRSNKITIAGVYEDFPLNSSYRPDVIISMPSIGYYTWDGSDELMGNDRYTTLIRLTKGTTAQMLNDQMERYVNTYLPVEEMKEWGVSMSYKALPYTQYHNSDAASRNKMLVLALVSFALILTSVLNYILIVVSTSVVRSREMALRKCLGCENADMYKMMFSESMVHTLSATGIGIGLLFLCHGYVEELSGTTVPALFTGKPLILAICIVVAVTIINGLIPAIMFNRIPVASAFRSYHSAKRLWKLGLLAAEFCAVAFLGVLVSIISLQYNRLTNADYGFDYNNVLHIAFPESDAAQQARICKELDNMASVEDYGFCYLENPLGSYDGQNVRIPGEKRELFNMRDGYNVDERFITTLGLKIIEGRNFTPGLEADKEVLIDRSFADFLRKSEGWNQVIGREVIITGHTGRGEDPVTIVGIFENIVTGSLQSASQEWDSRPMAFFYQKPHDTESNRHQYPYIDIRFTQIDQQKITEVVNMINQILPDQAIYVSPLNQVRLSMFDDTMKTRNSILTGGIVALLIAIFGLLGYTIDEVKRRSKEIAIRRINGALFREIRIMFIADIMKIAVPSTLAGCLLAAVTAQRWEQNFSIQAGMPWWIFIVTIASLLLLVSAISATNVNRISKTNPAESIKTE